MATVKRRSNLTRLRICSYDRYRVTQDSLFLTLYTQLFVIIMIWILLVGDFKYENEVFLEKMVDNYSL